MRARDVRISSVLCSCFTSERGGRNVREGGRNVREGNYIDVSPLERKESKGRMIVS